MKLVAVGDGLFQDRKGGGRRYLSEVASRLAGRSHRVAVVGPRLERSLPAREMLAGVQVLRYEPGSGPLALASRYRSARRTFEDALSGGCDVVNVHFAQAAFAGLRSPRAATLPVVYNFQGPWPGEVSVERRARGQGLPAAARAARSLADQMVFWAMFVMERAVVRRSDRFIVLSEFSRDILRRWYGVRPDLVSVIPSGVDTDTFRPAACRSRLRAEMGVREDTLLLFTARRLVSRMGLELLLEAFKLVAGDRRVRLAIAGDGPRREALERMALTLGVDGLVGWLGGVPDQELVTWYQAADLVMVPTVAFEGFGLVTVEALACGTPVVATPVGASPEILRPLCPALVAPAAEPEALADAILRAQARMPDREACRRHAVANYSWEVILPRVEAELAGAAAAGRDGPHPDPLPGGKGES